jgi:N-acetylglucosamine-6-phosphate deacetylase
MKVSSATIEVMVKGLLVATEVPSYLANLTSNCMNAIDGAVKVAHQVHQMGNSDGAELTAGCSGFGPVVMTTLAPKLPSALELSEVLVGSGIIFSLGCSNTIAGQARAGFDAGATDFTPALKAMLGITARAPGPAGMALSREKIWLQLIPSFLHRERTLAEVVLKFKPHRIVPVTDCLPVTASSETLFTLAGTDIELSEGKALIRKGVLAGSVLTMGEALQKAMAWGVSKIKAVFAISLNPRRLLNLHSGGPLTAGSVADVLIMSDTGEIYGVFRHRSPLSMQAAS